MNDDASIVKIASQWLVAAVLAMVLAALSLAVLAAQITSEDTGHRIQRRAAAALTDIDQVLPGIEPKLKEAAESSEGPVRVPDYPLPIDLPKEDAQRLQGAELRQRLLDESATVLYRDGMSAWADNDPEAEQSIARLSSAGAVYRGLGAVREDAHDFYVIAALVLAVFAIMLAALLTFTINSGFLRLIAMGGVILAAGLPLLAASVGARFAFKTAQSDADAFVDSLLELGVDTMWLPIRMYLAMTALGLAIIAISSVAMWLSVRSAGGTYRGGGAPGAPPVHRTGPP